MLNVGPYISSGALTTVADAAVGTSELMEIPAGSRLQVQRFYVDHQEDVIAEGAYFEFQLDGRTLRGLRIEAAGRYRELSSQLLPEGVWLESGTPRVRLVNDSGAEVIFRPVLTGTLHGRNGSF